MQVAKGEPSLNITQELLDKLNSSQDLTSGGLLQLTHIIPDILNLHQVNFLLILLEKLSCYMI